MRIHAPSLSTLVIVAAGVGAGGLMAAPSAVAASTVSVTVDCEADVVVYGVPGDTVVITLGAGCPDEEGGFGAATDGFLDNPTSVVNGTIERNLPRNWWVYSDGSGTTTITTTLMPTSSDGPIGVADEVGYFAIDGGGAWQLLYGGAEPASGSATSSPPSTWIQAYGRPDAGTPCAAGYAPSWAQWPGGGLGGWTCERSIVWNPATGTWGDVVGAW